MVGIYEIGEDTLKLCLVSGGTKPPTGFKTGPDDETMVLWEIAGTSHGDQYMAVAPIDTGSLPIVELAAAWRPVAEFLGNTNGTCWSGAAP